MLNEAAGLARIVLSTSWTQFVILRPSNNPERLHLFFSPLKNSPMALLKMRLIFHFHHPGSVCISFLNLVGEKKCYL